MAATRTEPHFGAPQADRVVRVEQIDPLSDPRWDTFVEQHPLGWLSHTSAWAHVLIDSFKQLEPAYLALIEGDDLRAALCLFRVDSWLLGRRLVSLPFTTLCDPLVRDESELKILLDAAADQHVLAGANYLELRTLRAGRLLKGGGFSVDRYFKYHSLALTGSLDDVKRRLHRRSIRPCIHRAERSKLECRKASREKDVDRFYEIYVLTRKRLALPPLPRAFFISMFRRLYPDHLDLIFAEDGRQVAGAIILLKFGSKVSAEASGWDRRYEDQRANHLLLWEGIKLAHAEGFEHFDFGRTASDNTPLMEFKGRWGTTVEDMDFGFYPPATNGSARINGLAVLAVKLACRATPLGLFPTLGRFCYRHTS